MEITAKTSIKNENGQVVETKSATVEYDFGSDVHEAIEKFGVDVVGNIFFAKAKIDCQAVVRRCLENGMAEDAIQARIDTWVPGQKLERIADPVGSLKKKLVAGEISAEDREALLAMLQAELG